MPTPLLGPAASVSASGLNFIGGQLADVRNMKFNREMYELQKRDALEFWNMQNAYNSPAAQMQRFQEAGLNPHLIYGQGNAGNAAQVQTPDINSHQAFREPNFGTGQGAISALSSMYDIEIKQAQADNLREQNNVIRQDGILRGVQVLDTLRNAQRKEFDLDFDKELRDVSADARRESLRQLRTNVDISLRRDAREAAMNVVSVEEAAERISTMVEQRRMLPLERDRIRQTIALLKKDNSLRNLDIALKKKGVSWSDPQWSRMLSLGLDKILDSGFSPREAAANFMQTFWYFLSPIK